jgi:hypothetical protein
MRKRINYYPCAFGSRVDESTMAWLEQRAGEERLQLSAYVRKLIEQEARRDLLQRSSEGVQGDRLQV